MTYVLKALRASAWFLFAMGLFHLLVHLKDRTNLANPADGKAKDLAAAMRAYTVADFPIKRSMLAVHEGLSLATCLFPMLVAALILVAVSELKDKPEGLRRLSRIYVAGLFVFTVVSINYFAWPQTVILLVSFGLGAFTLARLRKAA